MLIHVFGMRVAVYLFQSEGFICQCFREVILLLLFEIESVSRAIPFYITAVGDGIFESVRYLTYVYQHGDSCLCCDHPRVYLVPHPSV